MIIPLFKENEKVGETIVDKEYYYDLIKYIWRIDRDGYACRYIYNSKDQSTKKLLMHRYILNITDPNIHVDHKDRNRTNNQKYNLRKCTQALNAQNRESKKGSSSKYRNVYWEPERKKWRVQCVLNYKKYVVGRYNTEKEANLVAIRWRKENMPFSEENNYG